MNEVTMSRLAPLNEKENHIYWTLSEGLVGVGSQNLQHKFMWVRDRGAKM